MASRGLRATTGCPWPSSPSCSPPHRGLAGRGRRGGRERRGQPGGPDPIRWGEPAPSRGAGGRLARSVGDGERRREARGCGHGDSLAALQEDVEVAVAFERIPLQVRCTASDGEAVAFSGAGEVLWGDSATVGWKLRPGWHVERVLVNGTEDESLSGADGLVLPSVTEDVTVHGGGARVLRGPPSLPAGRARLHHGLGPGIHGDAHTVSWTANPGWRVAQVLIDGVEHGELTGAGRGRAIPSPAW
ncbi:MAG: hypothetical protein ACLSDQ_03900 [Adlercreutzia equolifaciens]